MCAAVCSTNALLVGDAAEVSNMYRKRVLGRNANRKNDDLSLNGEYANLAQLAGARV